MSIVNAQTPAWVICDAEGVEQAIRHDRPDDHNHCLFLRINFLVGVLIGSINAKRGGRGRFVGLLLCAVVWRFHHRVHWRQPTEQIP